MVGLTNIHDGALGDLILDSDGALVDPSHALFGRCVGGHVDASVCQAWDRNDTVLPCRPYRYALTRTWDSRPPAVFCMLNPSTADAFRLDPTLTRCRDFARRWRCGGMVIINAFGLRATDPKVLRHHPDPVGPHNDAVIAAVLAAGDVGPVVVGWGGDVTMARSGRAADLLKVIRAAGRHPLALDVNRDGTPKHPLYVSARTRPTPYLEG